MAECSCVSTRSVPAIVAANRCSVQVVSSMEELYKFMNQSNATLDLKVGSELATEPLPEGEVAEVHPDFCLAQLGMPYLLANESAEPAPSSSVLSDRD